MSSRNYFSIFLQLFMVSACNSFQRIIFEFLFTICHANGKYIATGDIVNQKIFEAPSSSHVY
jgi:hypothetical protein